MFYSYYWIFIAAMLVCALIGGYANSKVHSAYKRYGAIPTRSHMTGYDTAKKLLRVNNIHGISVGRTKGILSDHYHPKKRKSIFPKACTVVILSRRLPLRRTRSGTSYSGKRGTYFINCVP
ncbi:MAG: zinc metallopeptidase [Clostridia bacterium]|nr:zinc metallopeptidase [Clostridia bacterium]